MLSIEVDEMGDRGSGGTPKPASARTSDERSGARSGKLALKVSVIIGELPDSSRSRLRGDPWSSGGRSSIKFKISLSIKRRLFFRLRGFDPKFQPDVERTKRSSVAVTPS